MNIKKLVFWMLSTFLVGVVTSLVLGAIFFWPANDYLSFTNKQLFLGLTLAAVAELGFFAYLIFNWLIQGLLRRKSIRNGVLIFLVSIIMTNLSYYFIYNYDSQKLVTFFGILAFVFFYSLYVAYLKCKQTSTAAFVPTFFFMFVVTFLESVPSINVSKVFIPISFMAFTVTVFLLCNTWQIMLLQYLSNKNKKEPVLI